jgi:hypothetical protein
VKLTTDITPRRDGTVLAKAPNKSYTFKADADSRLVADVVDEADIGFLLDSGNFYPADDADHEAGLQAVKKLEQTGAQAAAPASAPTTASGAGTPAAAPAKAVPAKAKTKSK